MSSSFCFIVNTASNKGKGWPFFRDKLGYVKERFPNARYIYIREGDSIETEVSRVVHAYKYIVAVGGDGTVQQVAKALVGTNTILGVLPLGSGNDFAKSIGMTLRFEEDLKLLESPKTEQVDVIKTNGDVFLNTFGIGVDGRTNYYSELSPIKSGSIRYFISALRGIFYSDTFSYTCTVDDESIEGESWMIVAANGAVEGGRYKISPGSNNADGIFEVVIIRDIPLVRLLIEFLKLTLGITFDENVILIKKCRSDASVKLNKAVYGHADGEIVPPSDQFDFHINKQAITVVTSR